MRPSKPTSKTTRKVSSVDPLLEATRISQTGHPKTPSSAPTSLSSRVAALLVAHDDHWYLDATIRSLRGRVPAYVFVNRVPFFGEAGDWHRASQVAEAAGATVVLGEWSGEIEHRRAAGEHLLALGFTHALLPDGDEIIEESLLDALLRIAEADLADYVQICWDTYWKSAEYVIRPREGFRPSYLAKLGVAYPVNGHGYLGGRGMYLDEGHGIVHHLSWVGPEERIRRKLASWAHAKEVLPGWYNQVWRAWDASPMLRSIHPTHPEAYGFAERIEPPAILRKFLPDSIPAPQAPLETPTKFPWPKVSVVIPLWGGEEDIRLCLESLEPLHAEGLLHEVVIVDNASPDGAAEVAAGFSFVTLHRNAENRGFGGASNQGAALASGELLLFLNSDTVVPRSGLIRLVEGLLASHVIAAAGPYTNSAVGMQGIGVTYTRLGNLSLFAESFALREQGDLDTDFLVGFCVLIRRTAWDEVGGFDEGFGLGTFEDNDLSYRLRRKGYRLVVPGRAFVHHSGSKTFRRMGIDMEPLLQENYRRFREKWREDLSSGFASHLSGLASERHEKIVFQGSA